LDLAAALVRASFDPRDSRDCFLRIEEPVSELELHLSAPVARTLESWDWQASDPLLRDAVPTVARGHNLVAVLPPSPAAASPLIGAVLGRLGNGVRGLMVVPPGMLAEWAGVVFGVAAGTGLKVGAALASARALRELRGGSLDLLVASPSVIQELMTSSALKAEGLGVIVLAQPEAWAGHSAVSPLMQDLPLDAQRVILTADPAAAADLVERYARKALVLGTPPAEAPPIQPVGPVRTVSVPWSRRAAALGELLQLLDPASVTIWAHDRSSAAEIARAVPVDGETIRLVTGDAPKSSLIIAFDLPSHERLSQLVQSGDTVLLVPPGTESYVAGIARPARALRLPGLLEEHAAISAADRARIRSELESGNGASALLALAPLFEQHDPTRVAAALYALWKDQSAKPAGSQVAGGQSSGNAAPGAQAASAAPAIAKVWVSIGKKDGVTPADLVGALTKELRVERTAIGRVELRDGFCLIELPAADADRIAQALSGKMIRKVRVTARLDRLPGASPERRPRTGAGRPRP